MPMVGMPAAVADCKPKRESSRAIDAASLEPTKLRPS
jgi:hypothetical protein